MTGMELCARLLVPGLPQWLARWKIGGITFYGAFNRVILPSGVQQYGDQIQVTPGGAFPFGLEVLPDHT